MNVFGAATPPPARLWVDGVTDNVLEGAGVVNEPYSFSIPLALYQHLLASMVPGTTANAIGAGEVFAATLRITANRNGAAAGAIAITNVALTHNATNSTGLTGAVIEDQGVGTGIIEVRMTTNGANQAAPGGFMNVSFTATATDIRVGFTAALYIAHGNPLAANVTRIPLIDNSLLVTRPGVRRADITIERVASLPEMLAPTATGIGNIRIAERRQGDFFTGMAENTIRLEAPAGYNWSGTPSVRALEGTAFTAVAGTVANTSDTVRTVTITGITRATGLQGLGTGSIEITGLQLIPQVGTVIVPGDLSGAVRMGASAGIAEVTAGEWSRGFVIARQELSGVTITRVPVAVPMPAPLFVRSGIRNPGWDTNRPNNITITENGVDTLLRNFSFLVELNQPGVQFASVEWRTYGVGITDLSATNPSWNGGAANNVTISEDGKRAVLGVAIGNNTERRVIELRFQLNTEPNFVGRMDENAVTVNINGVAARHTHITAQDVVIATVRDPITLAADDPVEVALGTDLIGVTINQQLANATVTERAAGELKVGENIDVFLVPTLGGTSFAVPLGWGGQLQFTTRTATIEGTNGLRLVYVGAISRDDTTNAPYNATNGFRFRVVRASTGDSGGSFDIINNFIVGSMFNHPELQFELVLAGNAITGNRLRAQQNATPGVVIDNPVSEPYMIPIGVVSQEAPDMIGIGVQPPSQGPNQLPGLGAALFTLPAASMQNGMIGLAAFAAALEELTGVDANPGFEATATDVFGWFSGINASGQLVKLTVTQGATLAERDINGVPGTVRIDAPINIGGSLFVPVSTITNAFGYASRTNNGTVEFLIP
jgi:hypothetical protein